MAVLNLAEGRDIYDWGGGPTLYISEDGQVGNFNRFFAHQHPPVEVVVIRDFTAEVRPQWVFDLHENYGSKYSLYANVSTELGKRGAREMTKAVEARGMELMRLEELFSYVKPPHPEFLTEPSPGIFMPSRDDRSRGARCVRGIRRKFGCRLLYNRNGT